jgi:AcrR family transcriptional regulator
MHMNELTPAGTAGEQTWPEPAKGHPWEGLDRVRLAAIGLFAKNGYDGASISAIASKAGIRKSSVYAHCDGKESLFVDLMAPAIQRELWILDNALAAPGGQGPRLYLEGVGKRLEEDPPFLLFLLKAIYTPPECLKDVLFDDSHGLYQKIGDRVAPFLAGPGQSPEKAGLLARAYLSVLDSVQVAVLYCPWILEERLEMLWSMMELYRKSLA